MDWLHDQWRQIRGNVKWDFFKWLLAPAMSASSYVLMQKLRHLSWDWWVFGGLFLVSLVLLILLGRRPNHMVIKKKGNVQDSLTFSPEPRDLQDRVGSLAHELLQFLKEKGPRPEAHIDNSMSDEEILEAGSEASSAWIEAVHHGYFGEFKDRVEKMVHELASISISYPALDDSLINPNVQNAEKIRAIAEKLLLLRNKLEMREYEISPSDTSLDPNGLMPVANKSRLSIGTKLAAPSPNVVFSHCRVEAMSVEDEDYGATIFGAVVAEFFNDVSEPKDRADDVVAHLAYFERLNSDQQLRDPLWVSRQGVWLPERVGDWDFEMNGRGRLLVALILREDNSKPPSICAVGFRPPDSLNPFRMETFELEEYQPVIVHVTLRGSRFQRRFGFILERSRERYTCGQLATPA